MRTDVRLNSLARGCVSETLRSQLNSAAPVSYLAEGEPGPLTPTREGLDGIMIPQLSTPGTTPEKTTPEARCALALSLLQHRDPSWPLVALVTAVMEGASWDKIVSLDEAARG